MSLSAGNRIGPYEVLAPLGAGGMGEVYKARDTRLDRTVAIKVLPDHIAQREDLRARFEREARAVASLNHSHICTLFDVGSQNGFSYMVLELLEGETLAARLEKGPIPLDQALQLAEQIADALDRAHRAGVTHRDVKPQNIMLTRDGVKVLDFGLARSTAAKQGRIEATLTSALTAEGTVFGTPQYMAPEQFEGKEADARADIWAFGAVLYEMVTGHKAFQGKSYSSLVGAILASEPPPMAVKPFTPSWLERLVRRCLAKDPDDRWQSMRDIVLELRAPPQEAATSSRQSRWPWAVAAAGLLVAAAVVVMLRRPTDEATGPVEFEIQVPGGSRNISVSPNGKILAWRDDRKLGLWVRSVDSSNLRMIEQYSNPVSMSWSPDSRFLVYAGARDVRKLEVSTWTTQLVVAGGGTSYGTSWTSDGYILIGSIRGPLMKVPAAGGQLVPAWPLNEKEGEIAQRYPVVLPDGKHVLYLSQRPNQAGGVYLARVDGKASPRRVYRGVPFNFVRRDTLLVNDGGRLMAMKFDVESGATGEPALVSDGVTFFSPSADGRVLAFVGGTSLPEELVLCDRSGKKLETIADAGPFMNAHLEFSPDGRRLLLERSTGSNIDLWTVELGRKVVSRLTFDESSDGPGVWSADGRKVYFRGTRPQPGEAIFEIPANGTGTEKLLLKTQTHHLHASPDGKFLIFERTTAASGLAFIDLVNANKPEVYLSHQAGSPQFSPDSRYVMYESDETGRSEVYVQTFPAGGGKWQISTEGGLEARWRGDGREIFYDKGDGTVMAASIEMRGGSLEVTSTKELFKFRRGRVSGTALAVTPDGKLFAIRESPTGGEAPITLRLNWKLPGR